MLLTSLTLSLFLLMILFTHIFIFKIDYYTFYTLMNSFCFIPKTAQIHVLRINKGYKINIDLGCPPVRGDNPRDLASRLSYAKVTHSRTGRRISHGYNPASFVAIRIGP